MRTFTVKRKKHFFGSSEAYTLTISDSLGLRSVKLANGQTLSLPVDDGQVELKVGAMSITGYTESKPIDAPPGGDMSFAVETGYDVYMGVTYTIKRTDK